MERSSNEGQIDNHRVHVASADIHLQLYLCRSIFAHDCLCISMHIWAKQPRDVDTVTHGGLRVESGLCAERMKCIAG